MSIILPETSTDSDKNFDIIDFIEDAENSFFKLSNSSGAEIRISYIPKVDSSWDPLRFDLYLLDNPYLNAENDVFEVYDEEIRTGRLGWIFPITILVSNDNDFDNYKNLNKYKYVSQYKLLNEHANRLKNTNVNSDLLITDIYHEASLVCILSKDSTEAISDYDFNKYRLSLYKYGYSFFQEDFIRKPILLKSDLVTEMRGERRRVSLKRAKFEMTSNKYIDSLFNKYLLKTDDFLVRFIFLYQIIEQLMEDEFSHLFESYLDDYSNKKISKNDFKEYLNTASKERDLIKNVFNNTIIASNLQTDFDAAFTYLFKELSYKTRNSLPDKIYDFRNLLTHGYRNVIEKESAISELVQIFEDIIICILINYDKKQDRLMEAS